MISIEDLRFRCSSLSHITSETGGITAKQLETLRDLQKRKDEGLKPLTANMEKELSELIKKRDNKELPESVKTHLIDLYTANFEGRRDDIDSYAIEKGNVREKGALILTGKHLKRKLTKNEERKTDNIITGECDTFFSDLTNKYTLDTKCSYTRISFNRKRFLSQIDANYEEQGRGYMRLWNADCHIVSHCSMNGLPNHIESEINRLRFYHEVGSNTWTERAKQIEINHIVDLAEFMAEFPDYKLINSISDWHYDIHWKDRVYMWQFERDINWENKLEVRAKECIDWMNTNLFKVK